MRASPDVETVPPEPLPDARDGRAGAPARAEGVTWTTITAVVLAWGLLAGLAYLAWAPVSEIPTMRRVPVDMYVAVATLVLLALGLLLWTVRRVARRGRSMERVRGDSQWAIAGRHFRRNRMAMGGLVIMILLYVVTLLTPLIAPYDPAAQGDIVATRYLEPSWEHLMGTDKFGRDILSRVLYGARISLSIGFIAVGISITLGTLLGAVAGYFGGITDGVLMRLTDMMLSFPRLVLLIVVIALFEPSIWLVVVVLGLTGWMGTARIVRGEVLSLREREFVQAARALGMGDGRIILRHVIPNTLAPVIVSATLGIGQTILTEASLSFLGLGVQPPTPSWGNMISDGRDALVTAWWIATFPGLAIVFTVIAFNLLGDGLRDALDPRLRT
ncbi:MAG TPA: oligopeptide ABC transporter permease [Longimicrobiaceae bacterium]|nr:oligopeptide ABC transporter permease [Longimicrobiaceae bacterium]